MIKHLSLVAALGTMMVAPAAMAQATGSIHGQVTAPTGAPFTEGDVKLTTDESGDLNARKYPYDFQVDAQGQFKGTDIKPGTYTLVFFDKGQHVDFLQNVKIVAGQDTVANDDMTRAEFINALSPEQKKQLEEIKKKNATVMNANKQIANLNGLLTQARADIKAGNFDAAITSMTTATQQKPDEPLLWMELGNADLGAKKYDDAQTAFQKVVDLNAASKKPNPAIAAAAYNNMGQAYAKSGKAKEATEAYENAAKTEPAKAGMYYFNEAATLINSGQNEAAAKAADQAIAADPTRADTYFIKGQALVGNSTVDSKSGKIVPPPGCMEAYQKYLELAPNGPHAPEVKQIVAGFDEKVVSSYKAGHKH